MFRSLLLLLLSVSFSCLGWSAHAQFKTTVLHGCSVPVVQAGTQTEVQFYGENLEELQDIHFTGRALSADVLFDKRPFIDGFEFALNKAVLKPESAIQRGLYTYRLQGRFGISNPATLLICGQPVMKLQHEQTAPQTAIAIRPGQIYWGQFQERKLVYTTLSLQQRQRIKVVAYAAQLGSLAIPALKLIAPDGKQIAISRQSEYWPAELNLIVPASGEYQLVLNDFLYQGGPRYPYLLEVGVASAEQNVSLELNQLLRPDLQQNRDETLYDNPLRVYGSFNPFEIQPLNMENAEAVTELPFYGLLDLNDAQAQVSFRAHKDQLIAFEVLSAQLNQLTDPQLNVSYVNPETGQLQHKLFVEDLSYTGGPELRLRPLDPAIQMKVPETGQYQVSLKDSFNNQFPQITPKAFLKVAPVEQSFSLLTSPHSPAADPNKVEPFGIRIFKGGAFAIDIQLVRHDGFDSPVRLSINGLPEKMHSQPSVIAAGQTSGVLIVEADEDCETWCGPIEIIGSSTAENADVTALYATISRETLKHSNKIVSRLMPEFWISLSSNDQSPLQIATDSGSLEVRQGEKVKLPVKLKREEIAAEAVTLKANDLPAKVTFKDIKIEKSESAGEGELSVSKETPVGEYTVWLEAETKVKWQENPEAVSELTNYLEQLKSLKRDSTDMTAIDSFEAQIQKTQAQLEELKKLSAAKTIAISVPGPSIRLKVLAAQQ